MKKLLAIAVAVTLSAVLTWLVTGAHPYTKFEDVLRENVAVDPDDPFAEAGFYEGTTVTRTVKKNVFYFGLLPTPSGLFDPHALSVLSVAAPLWAIAGGAGLLWWRHQRALKAKLFASSQLTRSNTHASQHPLQRARAGCGRGACSGTSQEPV